MHSFHKYIKAVGIGVKHNHDLSVEEMKDAMSMMLEGDVSPEQISAFLLGWRLKPESIDEFKGALLACDEVITQEPIANSIELGFPYDGLRKFPYLFPHVAKYLKPFGIELVISGDLLQPSKEGVSTKYVCENSTLSDNIHFFDRATYAPKISALTDVRMKLGLRTGLNTIERLLNPAQSEYGILGVFHKPYVKKYQKAYQGRYKKMMIVKGKEGSPEIFGKTMIWVVEGENVEEIHINPKDYGIGEIYALKDLSDEKFLEYVKVIDEDMQGMARLNAALYLWMMGKADDFDSAYGMIQK